MLATEQEEQFYEQGYVVLKGAFPREDAIAWVRAECARAGYNLDDPDTWTREYDRIPTQRKERLRDYAPAAWELACDLMGGLDRVGHERVSGTISRSRESVTSPPTMDRLTPPGARNRDRPVSIYHDAGGSSG